MSQRWSINEDIVVCKYCVDNPWAYTRDVDIEGIAAKLEAAGFQSRSKSAIKQRVYAYEVLMMRRKFSCVTNQTERVYQIIGLESRQMTKGIKSYIREVYKPEDDSKILDDISPFTSLTKKPSDALELVRTIDYKSTFPMVLQKYVDLKGIKKHNAMCRGIGMKPDTFSAILRGKYKEVKKDNVLRLCVGLGLHVNEAEELLESAGYMFSNSVMKDVVVKAFLWDGIYSVVAINAELDENNEAMLFENYEIDYKI